MRKTYQIGSRCRGGREKEIGELGFLKSPLLIAHARREMKRRKRWSYSTVVALLEVK